MNEDYPEVFAEFDGAFVSEPARVARRDWITINFVSTTTATTTTTPSYLVLIIYRSARAVPLFVFVIWKRGAYTRNFAF